MIEVVRNLIVAAAIAHGVATVPMIETARCESNFNAFAVNGPNRGLYQLSVYGKLWEFYGRGFDDEWDPSQQANFAAEQFAEGQARAWTCARKYISVGLLP